MAEKKTKVNAQTIQESLDAVASQGHGQLSHDELKQHLSGGIKVADTRIIPDDVKISPAGARTRAGRSAPKAPEDYIDRLLTPASDRMARIAEMEKHGQPFISHVVSNLIADPSIAIHGKDNYTTLAAKAATGTSMSAKEVREMKSFYSSVLSKIKYGDIPHNSIVHALEAVDSAGKGTMHVDEFKGSFSKLMKKAS